MANRMDEIAAKGMGMAKGVKARLSGLVGVFKTLSEQHGEASVLLKRVKGDAAKRSELWPEIRKALVSHERGEMQELYPELRNHDATRALAQQHDLEAHQLDELIDKLQTTEISSATWGQMFDRLVDMVLAHAEEEEKQIFPKAQDAIGEDRAKQIDDRFLAAQKQIKAAL